MRRSPLAIILMTVFIALIGFGIVIPLIPVYAEKYGASGVHVGMLIMVYSLMQFIFAPIFGRLSDRIGRRPVLIGALLLTSASYILFAMANSLEMLFLSRILAGLGGADITVAQAYIADVTPPEKRARGMGLFGAAFGVGFVIGPALTGITAPFGDWVPAVVAAGMAGITSILAFFLLPEPDRPAADERAKLPKYRVTKPVVIISAAYFLSTFSISQLQSMIVLFTVKLFEWGASENGLFLAGFALMGAIIQGGLIGRLASRFGERNLTRAGMTLIGIGLLLSANAGPSLSLGTFVVPTLAEFWGEAARIRLLFGGSLVYAMGFAVLLPSLSSLISRRSPAGQQGQALGVYQSSGSLARILGPLVGGLLFDRVGIAAPLFVGGVVAMLTAVASIPVFSGSEWKNESYGEDLQGDSAPSPGAKEKLYLDNQQGFPPA